MTIQMIKYDSVDSTNNVAIRRIKRGKIKPTLIIANSQKRGRGQYGRKWTSYRGNIFMSFYFNLKKKLTIKTLSKKIYIIIQKSLEKFVNEEITIKLPNDLLIKGSKVCGILQETIVHGKNRYFIIGIGINLIKSPNIKNKQVSFLQKYNNNKINKTDIYKNIKNNFEKII
tara:strand:+ start:5372 stop:5884 length:513 start_codon:yes stop_codon:yes gene_type:complete